MPVVKIPTFPHKVTGMEIILGMEARGSIAKERTFQIGHVTPDGDPKHRKRVQLLYPYHVPDQPDTPAQLACRQNFTDGMTAWSGLATEQKETWNDLALEEYRHRSRQPGSYRIHSGCNLFMRDYLNNL